MLYLKYTFVKHFEEHLFKKIHQRSIPLARAGKRTKWTSRRRIDLEQVHFSKNIVFFWLNSLHKQSSSFCLVAWNECGFNGPRLLRPFQLLTSNDRLQAIAVAVKLTDINKDIMHIYINFRSRNPLPIFQRWNSLQLRPWGNSK